jgi:hypothetical protein
LPSINGARASVDGAGPIQEPRYWLSFSCGPAIFDLFDSFPHRKNEIVKWLRAEANKIDSGEDEYGDSDV